MKKRYYLIFLILLVGTSIYFFVDHRRGVVVNDPEGFALDQKIAIDKNNSEVLSREEFIGDMDPGSTQSIDPVSLLALREKNFIGKGFSVGKVIEQTTSYKKYFISYDSFGLKISGTMSVPTANTPTNGFPVVFTNHGYIDPAVYTNGRGLRREGAYLASQGFVVVHSDYRNHAQSDKDPDNDVNIRLGYIEDVINGIYAVKGAGLEYIDQDNIFLLGHSMGGGISQGLMVVKPRLVNAVVLYAPVSMDARDSFYRWTESRPETAKLIREIHGGPEENFEFWKNVSPISFISDVEVPVMIFHGTEDKDVPIEWSRNTKDALVKAGKKVELIEFEGEGHEFSFAHKNFMDSVNTFFENNMVQ